jgi:hypothetical protein
VASVAAALSNGQRPVGTITQTIRQVKLASSGAIAHMVAVVTLVLLSITGHQVEGLGGWLACPPRVIKLEEGRRSKRQDCGGEFAWRVM